MAGGQNGREICHANDTCIPIREEGVKRYNMWLLTRFQPQRCSVSDCGWIVGRDRAFLSDD